MSTPTSEISLHVQVTIDPKDVPAFVEAMTPIFDIVTAEPNCTFFEIYQSMEDPGTISWVENWSVVPGFLLFSNLTLFYRNATVEWFMEVDLTQNSDVYVCSRIVFRSKSRKTTTNHTLKKQSLCSRNLDAWSFTSARAVAFLCRRRRIGTYPRSTFRRLKLAIDKILFDSRKSLRLDCQ